MRLLSLQHQVLFRLECILLDLTFGQERNAELTPIEVEAVLDHIDAALVPLEVIKTEQEIHFVVFKDGE